MVVGGKRGGHRDLRRVDGREKGALRLTHERLVRLCTQLDVGEVCRAGVGRGQIVKGLGVVFARAHQSLDARHGLGRLEKPGSRDGAHAIGGEPAVFRDDLKARGEKRADLRCHLGGVEVHDARIPGKRHIDEARQLDFRAVEQDVHDADGRTAQREGVRAARGGISCGEDAAYGVELVGHRHDLAGRLARQLVAGKARAVVIGDGAGHLLALAACQRIMPAHHALQAGELDDGLTDEVSLAQVRGALRGLRARRVEACLLADGGGEFLDARRLVLHAAELFGEDDIGQLVHVAFQRHTLVFVHEKLRVGQTRAHDALIALSDGGVVGRVAVRDDDEGIVKRAVGAIHGEVALMLQHGVADNLGRHLQKLLVEMAQQRRRPLHEVHHLGKGAGRRVGR